MTIIFLNRTQCCINKNSSVQVNFLHKFFSIIDQWRNTLNFSHVAKKEMLVFYIIFRAKPKMNIWGLLLKNQKKKFDYCCSNIVFFFKINSLGVKWNYTSPKHCVSKLYTYSINPFKFVFTKFKVLKIVKCFQHLVINVFNEFLMVFNI